DRIGGTMLGGSQVFGWRAGTRAAEVARERPQRELGADELDALLLRTLAHAQESKGRTRPSDLLPPLQRKMWQTLLVERDADRLAEAKAFVVEQRARMHDDLRIADPFDLALMFEHRNLLDVAE